MTAFTASLSELLASIELVMDFFVEAFVGIADMLFNSPFVCVTHLIKRKGLRINSRMKRNPSNIIIISADAINSSPTIPREAGSPRRVDSA